MKKRRLAWIGILSFGAFAYVGWTQWFVPAVLHHEHFFRARPSSYWKAVLLTDDPKAYLETQETLGSGGRYALGVLMDLIDDPDVKVSTGAAAALNRDQDQCRSVVPRLMELMAKNVDRDPNNAELVLLELDEPTQKNAVRAMIALIKTQPVSYGSGREALIRVRKEDVDLVPDLVQIIQDKHLGDFHGEALNAARVIGRPAADVFAVASRMLPERNDGRAYEVVDALVAINPDKALPVLIDALSSSKPWVREASVHGLGEIGPGAASAVPNIMKLMSDDNEYVRWKATGSIGKLGPAAKAAVPLLIECLVNVVAPIQINAVESLGAIGPDAMEAVPSLIQALTIPNREIRWRVAEALVKIKPDPQCVVPALKTALNGADPFVRFRVTRAIQRLQEATPAPKPPNK